MPHFQRYDMIIVGGGGAGAVLAARLSEDGRRTRQLPRQPLHGQPDRQPPGEIRLMKLLLDCDPGHDHAIAVLYAVEVKLKRHGN